MIEPTFIPSISQDIELNIIIIEPVLPNNQDPITPVHTQLALNNELYVY